MIKIRAVDHIPLELLEALSEQGKRDYEFGARGVHSFVTVSDPLVCGVDDSGKPLFLAGAIRPSLISETKALWMLTTKYLTAKHARAMKRAFENWRGDKDSILLASSQTPTSARFLTFLGFELKLTNGKTQIYGSKQWA